MLSTKSENSIKKIPYGESNFKNIILDNSLYIDKTHFIETLENNHKFSVFLRPRRFGKSLFISTLQYYYDEYYQNDWDSLFAESYIGKHPTPLKSSYKVLFLEFSGIVTDDIHSIYQGFTHGIKNALLQYLKHYAYSTEDMLLIKECDAPELMMNTFFNLVEQDKIYLLIDEYDHFANSILGADFSLFKNIIGKGGFVRSFYETIKTATQRGIIERLFITGVTPITLDSLTSGFNIAENITQTIEFNELAGFNLSESKKVLNNIIRACPELDQQQLIKDITCFYNGYKFSPDAKNTVYNASLVMYFAKAFNKNTCQYPMKMLDSNIASDYTSIMQLFTIGDTEENYKILSELIRCGEITATLKDKFDFTSSSNDFFQYDDFISLLFAMGFVTIKETCFNEMVFVIPNYVIKHLYFNYFQKEIEYRNQLSFRDKELKSAIRELASSGDIQAFEQEVKRVIHILSNRDQQNFNEKHLQSIILTLLNISDFYFIKSEMEVNKKYPDIMLLQRNPFEVNYQYLFELKYSKKKDKDWAKKEQQGIKQIEGYLTLSDIKVLKNLKSYLIISDGDRLEIIKVKSP